MMTHVHVHDDATRHHPSINLPVEDESKRVLLQYQHLQVPISPMSGSGSLDDVMITPSSASSSASPLSDSSSSSSGSPAPSPSDSSAGLPMSTSDTYIAIPASPSAVGVGAFSPHTAGSSSVVPVPLSSPSSSTSPSSKMSSAYPARLAPLHAELKFLDDEWVTGPRTLIRMPCDRCCRSTSEPGLVASTWLQIFAWLFVVVFTLDYAVHLATFATYQTKATCMFMNITTSVSTCTSDASITASNSITHEPQDRPCLRPMLYWEWTGESDPTEQGAYEDSFGWAPELIVTPPPASHSKVNVTEMSVKMIARIIDQLPVGYSYSCMVNLAPSNALSSFTPGVRLGDPREPNDKFATGWLVYLALCAIAGLGTSVFQAYVIIKWSIRVELRARTKRLCCLCWKKRRVLHKMRQTPQSNQVRLAFLMGTHDRLGATKKGEDVCHIKQSFVNSPLFDYKLMYLIFSYDDNAHWGMNIIDQTTRQSRRIDQFNTNDHHLAVNTEDDHDDSTDEPAPDSTTNGESRTSPTSRGGEGRITITEGKYEEAEAEAAVNHDLL